MDPNAAKPTHAVPDPRLQSRPKVSDNQAIIPPYIGDPRKAMFVPIPQGPPVLPPYHDDEASAAPKGRVELPALNVAVASVTTVDSSVTPRPTKKLVVGDRVVFKPTLGTNNQRDREYAGGCDAYVSTFDAEANKIVVTLQKDCSTSVPIKAHPSEVVRTSQHRLFTNGQNKRWSIYGPMIHNIISDPLFFGVRMSTTIDSSVDTTLSTLPVRDIWVGDTVVIDTKIRNEVTALPYLIAGFVAYNPLTRTTRWANSTIYDRTSPNQWKVSGLWGNVAICA